MRGMGTIAQSVDDPRVQALKERAARLGNALHIRRVGEPSEAKTKRADVAVVEIERRRLDRSARALNATDLAGRKAQLLCDRRIRTSVRGFKNIRKGLGHPARGLLVHVHAQG